MSIDPKFVELTADVVRIIINKKFQWLDLYSLDADLARHLTTAYTASSVDYLYDLHDLYHIIYISL